MSFLITAIIFSLVLLDLIKTTIDNLKSDKSDYRKVFKCFRWFMIPIAIVTIIAVLFSSYFLLKIKILKFSWLNLLGMSGQNILLGSGISSSLTNSHNSLLQFLSTGISLLFPILILINIPILALGEERIFRRDFYSYNILQKIIASLFFGLFHFIVGVPLAVCISY